MGWNMNISGVAACYGLEKDGPGRVAAIARERRRDAHLFALAVALAEAANASDDHDGIIGQAARAVQDYRQELEESRELRRKARRLGL